MDEAYCADSPDHLFHTGEPGEALRVRVERVAVAVGRLEGTKAFFVALMQKRVGTNDVESKSMKICKEEGQRNLMRSGMVMRDEAVVLGLLKVVFKGIKGNIIKGRLILGQDFDAWVGEEGTVFGEAKER